jgi:hypothetical protein
VNAKQESANVVTLELKFPRGVPSARATQVAREIARAIQVDLIENGSDMWPGEVPKVQVKKSREVTS